MNSLSSIALSGLNVAQQRLDVSAHNVANAQTPGFRRQVLQAQTQPGGGVTAMVARADEVGNDLAGDMVQQSMALYAFKANMLSVKAEQDTLGRLLDTRA